MTASVTLVGPAASLESSEQRTLRAVNEPAAQACVSVRLSVARHDPDMTWCDVQGVAAAYHDQSTGTVSAREWRLPQFLLVTCWRSDVMRGVCAVGGPLVTDAQTRLAILCPRQRGGPTTVQHAAACMFVLFPEPHALAGISKWVELCFSAGRGTMARSRYHERGSSCQRNGHFVRARDCPLTWGPGLGSPLAAGLGRMIA